MTLDIKIELLLIIAFMCSMLVIAFLKKKIKKLTLALNEKNKAIQQAKSEIRTVNNEMATIQRGLLLHNICPKCFNSSIATTTEPDEYNKNYGFTHNNKSYKCADCDYNSSKESTCPICDKPVRFEKTGGKDYNIYPAYSEDHDIGIKGVTPKMVYVECTSCNWSQEALIEAGYVEHYGSDWANK